jgi:hypothetical protein
MQAGQYCPEAGFDKIKNCYEQAVTLEFVRVDTCCIDKNNSAKLFKAINSMYQWYCRSAVCYAYVSDNLVIPPLGNQRWGAMVEKSQLCLTAGHA